MKRRTVLLIFLFICITLSLFFYQEQSRNKTDIVSQQSEQTKDPIPSENMNQAEEPEKVFEEKETQSSKEKKGHWETVTMNEPGWDETVLIKEGWTETVLIKDAWDEEDTYCSVYGQDSYSGYECNCGKVSGTLEAVLQHIKEDENCNTWHNKTIYYGEPYCQAYQTDYIHHDAQYQTIYHDPEYRIVHHEGRTYEKRIWVEE